MDVMSSISNPDCDPIEIYGRVAFGERRSNYEKCQLMMDCPLWQVLTIQHRRKSCVGCHYIRHISAMLTLKVTRTCSVNKLFDICRLLDYLSKMVLRIVMK
ncbi:hypothetical protein CDAR_234221 [Caerostris darwini]|uniref:Uncharacterized protein n=1 Tax=Caerostris darwini TaxID=1538125 RepID=A0AAV4QG82_9ARAC|nr:hypothetical protein CDAR_234221 [Caerostris darwini]